MRFGRPALWAAAALGAAAMLGGCSNGVISSTPFFKAEDAVAPREGLRAGWWVIVDTGECRFDPAQPSGRWPSCLHPILAPETTAGDFTIADDQSAGAIRADYLLAAGDPMILQASLVSPQSEAAGQPRAYTYFAVRPIGRDAQGRAVEARFWQVLCGPPAPMGPSERAYGRVTKAPWPSVVEVRAGACRARDLDGLRDAALRSEALAERGGVQVRWLRERRADDQTMEQWLAAATQ